VGINTLSSKLPRLTPEQSGKAPHSYKTQQQLNHSANVTIQTDQFEPEQSTDYNLILLSWVLLINSLMIKTASIASPNIIETLVFATAPRVIGSMSACGMSDRSLYTLPPYSACATSSGISCCAYQSHFGLS
jgi:hypothetical protein